MAAITLILCALASNASAIATRFDNVLAPFGAPVRQLSSVNAIAQDKFGFVWLGGENGLARYDGTEFRLFQFDPAVEGGLPNNYIWQLSVDMDGYLWVVTSDGLCRFSHIQERFECGDSLLGALSETFISAVAFDNKNRLYAAVANGLYRMDLATKQIESWESDGGPIGATGAIYEDLLIEEGIVWLGSSNDGLARLNTRTGRFTYFYNDGRPGSLSGNRVKGLLRDSSGRLWVGMHGGGVNLMLPGSENFSQLNYVGRSTSNAQTAVIVDVMEDEAGRIWVAVDQEGVLVFNQNLQLVHQFTHASGDNGSLLSDRTKSVFEDINGDIWVGQAPFGVSFLNRGQEKVLTFQSDPTNPNTLSDNAVLSFLESRDGTVWVGTEGGLNAFNPDTGIFKRYLRDPDNPHALKANAVLALEEDARGHLWIGTWGGGLHRFDPEKEIFHRYGRNPSDPGSLGDDFIWSLLVDRNGTLWVGTESRGLRRYRPETDDFSSPSIAMEKGDVLSDSFVLAITEDRKGSLWIATYYGVHVYDKTDSEFRMYLHDPNDPGSLASNAASSILVDSRGGIWIGSDMGVSYKERAADNFRRITMADGLPAQTISSITEDRNGHIWLATTSGVARVNPDTFSIQTYNTEHGFVGSTYARDATLVDSKGRLYFGSTEGLTVFYPEDLKPISGNHPIWITHFRLANRNVPIGGPESILQQSILTTKHLALEYHQNIVSFDFVVLNFRSPGKNQYAYRLDGFDHDWQYIKHRNTATYTNLDPGHYVLRVKAQVAGASWVESEHTIVIDVAPPWWRTWWAYMLYAALIVGLGYVIYAIGRLKKSSDSFREQAIRDPLTGMYNRAGVQKIAQWMFADAEIQRGVCVMLMDIDHFKRINDTRGHDVGDRVIKGIAQILRETVRQGDHLGRWGGEEFVLLCAGSTKLGAEYLAKKICTSVADALFECDGQPLKVTISVGVALANADESFDRTLKRADELLYKAKAAGRNCAILENGEVLQ